MKMRSIQFLFGLSLLSAIFCANCATSANSRYFGETAPPRQNVLRYISGSEPKSLDPQITTGQPEARIHLSMFEGLVEYDPKTQNPIPALAESWEIAPTGDEYIFHLRKNAKWSDGKPITANDFVYTMRRGFAPETASSSAELGYFIKYAADYNGNAVFARGKNGDFLLAKDFAEKPIAEKPRTAFGADTEFRGFIVAPERLTLNGDEKKRQKEIDANPKLKAALADAKFVPVTKNDIGVEAVDDYTVRIVLRQPAPFFLGLLAHQFFRFVPQQTIEKYGKNWSRAENIVTCGAFKVKEHKPYDKLVVVRDPNYWDAANVKLDGIEFLAVEDQTTTMNLYKAGAVDAIYNHTVPVSWIDEIKPYKDEYLNFPENSTAYYSMNMKKPPFDNLKVRQAFNLAIDKEGLAQFRKILKPLYYLTPDNSFPDYDKARRKVSEELRQKANATPEEWAKRDHFNPERARKLLTEAGFAVQQTGDKFACPSFPADKIAFTYNTLESNRQTAEFVQAQWKQNLGITVPLKNMEFASFLQTKNKVEYDGLAQTLWTGDYIDPFTFLGLYYGEGNNGGSGFYDPKYDAMLDDANRELDPQTRFEKMARAEFYVLEQQPVIPLTISATNWMKKPYVKGMYPNVGTLHPWKYVYIERDAAKWDTDVENIMK